MVNAISFGLCMRKNHYLKVHSTDLKNLCLFAYFTCRVSHAHETVATGPVYHLHKMTFSWWSDNSSLSLTFSLMQSWREGELCLKLKSTWAAAWLLPVLCSALPQHIWVLVNLLHDVFGAIVTSTASNGTERKMLMNCSLRNVNEWW